ncbi:MAG: DinB family protein [Gemmatimonadales bacterium]
MSATAQRPEPWLRGPLPGIPPPLQPAAHALTMAQEDVEAAVAGLSADQLWLEPGGVASVGFHLAHLAGSTDRLFSYARGAELSDAQRAALARERSIRDERPSAEELLAEWRRTVAAALEQLAATPESTLSEARFVGRARLPSTVLGLLFHAAEHAARHTGQIVTTAKLLRGGA